jgi:non-homologous end joining protein Ku
MPSKSAGFKVQVKGSSITTLNIALHGMIPFPVKIYSPYNEEEKSGLKKGCPKCHNHVLQPPICSNADCVYHKGFPEHDGPIRIATEGMEIVPILGSELEDIALPTNKEFRVSAVVPFSEVEHLTYYAEGLYYTAPENAVSAMLYNTVLQSLKKSKRVIMGKFILKGNSTAETLGMLRVFGETLVIQKVPFAVARRPLPEFELPAVLAADINRLNGILAELPEKFVYTDVTDGWKDALTKFLQGKLRQKMGLDAGGIKKKAATKTISMGGSARAQMEALFGTIEAQGTSKKPARTAS